MLSRCEHVNLDKEFHTGLAMIEAQDAKNGARLIFFYVCGGVKGSRQMYKFVRRTLAQKSLRDQMGHNARTRASVTDGVLASEEWVRQSVASLFLGTPPAHIAAPP